MVNVALSSSLTGRWITDQLRQPAAANAKSAATYLSVIRAPDSAFPKGGCGCRRIGLYWQLMVP